MPKRSASQHVPKEMQARFEEITQLTDAFSRGYLNEEYLQLCRELTATLCRKRPSPLVRGKPEIWACAIVYALGTVNFLFDRSQTPHLRAAELCAAFGGISVPGLRYRRMFELHRRGGIPTGYAPVDRG